MGINANASDIPAADALTGDEVAYVVQNGNSRRSTTGAVAAHILIDEDDMASNDATKSPSQQSVKAFVENKILDEDDMASDSATSVPSQQSVKAYVDGKTFTDAISGVIETPDDQDYRLIVNFPFAGTIASTTTRSASGTCTATFKVNTTALGGTANSVSSTEQEQTHSTSNTFVAGDDLVLTVSSNSTCVDMSFTVEFTRTL